MLSVGTVRRQAVLHACIREARASGRSLSVSVLVIGRGWHKDGQCKALRQQGPLHLSITRMLRAESTLEDLRAFTTVALQGFIKLQSFEATRSFYRVLAKRQPQHHTKTAEVSLSVDYEQCEQHDTADHLVPVARVLRVITQQHAPKLCEVVLTGRAVGDKSRGYLQTLFPDVQLKVGPCVCTPAYATIHCQRVCHRPYSWINSACMGRM